MFVWLEIRADWVSRGSIASYLPLAGRSTPQSGGGRGPLQQTPCVKAPPVVVPMHDADLPVKGR